MFYSVIRDKYGRLEYRTLCLTKDAADKVTAHRLSRPKIQKAIVELDLCIRTEHKDWTQKDLINKYGKRQMPR